MKEFSRISVHAHPLIDMVITSPKMQEDTREVLSKLKFENVEFNKCESSFFLDSNLAQKIINELNRFIKQAQKINNAKL